MYRERTNSTKSEKTRQWVRSRYIDLKVAAAFAADAGDLWKLDWKSCGSSDFRRRL